MKAINLKEPCKTYREILGLEEKIHYETSRGLTPDALTSKRDALYDQLNESLSPVSAVLAEEQKRSRVRNITAADIVYYLCRIEDKLCIPKKYMNGIEVRVDDNAQSFPNAYRGQPESTQFEAKFTNGSWKLTSVYRHFTNPPSRRIIVTHTEESKQALIDRFTTFSSCR